MDKDIIDVLKKKYPVAEKLEESGVVGFGFIDDTCVLVEECCDNWFWCTLNLEEVLQLAEFLKELASSMQ